MTTCLLMIFVQAAQPAEVRLDLVADAGISSYPAERPVNYGARPIIRIKGLEMMLLVRPDTAPLAGRRVVEARFRFRAVQHRFRWLGFSTVAADWTEGTGTGGDDDRGTCFDARALPDGTLVPWARAGGDFTDVAWTAGGTVCSYGEVRDEGDGWLSAPVDPALLELCAAGRSDGLCITDECGQTRFNNDVYAREQSNSKPYFLVRLEPAEAPAATVSNVALTPRNPARELGRGAALLTFELAAEERDLPRLSFGVTVGGEPLPRWRLPRPRRGTNLVVLGDGPPEAPLSVGLSVGGRTIAVNGRSGPALPPVALAAPADDRRPSPPADVFAVPLTTPVDPVAGSEARRLNPVWDAAGVRLRGGRGEAVYVQIVAEGPRAPGAFEPTGGIPADWLTTFAVGYLPGDPPIPEFAVPADRPVPPGVAEVPGQRFWPLLVRVQIPADATPGDLTGDWRLGDQRVPVRLTVWSHRLPDELNFDVSLNSYGRVHGQAGVEDGATDAAIAAENAYHRLAHRLRLTWAPLGYSHSGRLDWAAAPTLSGRGADTVCDFTDYDRRWGALCDGSAFADLPRAGVPLDHAYLAFCESWPAAMTEYDYQPTTTAYPDNIAEHAMRARPIETMFSADYVAANHVVAQQTAEHVRDRGWLRTEFQAYCNNKYYYKDPAQGGRGTSWWLLDEPMHREDWLALAWFARLFREGADAVPGPRLPIRFDISRPQWQRDWLDGFAGNTYVVGGDYYRFRERILAWAEREQAVVWTYGSANAPGTDNSAGVAWCLKAWLAGADGVVPWNSIGGAGNFTEPSETALMLPGRPLGLSEPVASLRLLALSVGQQEAERLRLLAAKTGWTRDQIALAVAPHLDLEATAVQRFVDDAAPLTFTALSADGLEALRGAVAAALEAP